jgi:hypothetical protein
MIALPLIHEQGEAARQRFSLPWTCAHFCGGHILDTLEDPPKEKGKAVSSFPLSFQHLKMPPARFERTAPGLGILCSIHLSYGGTSNIS